MAVGRLIGQRGRRSSSAALHQNVVGKGKIFMEGADGKLFEIINPNNPTDMDAVKVRPLSEQQSKEQRRRFLRGRAGAVAGRGKTKPKSRVRALEINEFRLIERAKREEEEQGLKARPSVGRRIR